MPSPVTSSQERLMYAVSSSHDGRCLREGIERSLRGRYAISTLHRLGQASAYEHTMVHSCR